MSILYVNKTSISYEDKQLPQLHPGPASRGIFGPASFFSIANRPKTYIIAFLGKPDFKFDFSFPTSQIFLPLTAKDFLRKSQKTAKLHIFFTLL